MRKLLCFDMDMTLLDHSTMKIPDSALFGLHQLREKGHLVAIASGRDMDSTFSRTWGEAVEHDAVVHSNGQKVTVGDQIIREIFMEKELVRRLVEYGESHDLCIGFNIGNAGAFVHPEIVEQREKRTFGSCDRSFIPASALFQENLYSLVIFGRDSEDTVKRARELETHFPEIKCALFSSNVGADVIDRRASKSEGIRCLLNYYGMDFQDVVAFGDSMNDMEMIRDAGIGVAMGNAIGPLKEMADFVTKPIGEDGVLYGLKKLGLV